MNRIRVLDEGAINKIAAGEVVENAASVVKELVENAIDAGASEVGVWIKAGGRQLIRVADDGCGMSRDDALLCLERHATSKIRSAEELDGVSTLGFRGEAVPAIAAVSKLSLLTATEAGAGTQLLVDGGKIRRCGEGARSPGTTFEVQALFHNTPARRAFQKSVAHDVGEVQRVVASLALAHPEVRLQLVSGESEALACGATRGERLERLGERVAQVLGDELFGSLRPVEAKQGEISVWGYICDPSLTRPTRKGQHLFINGRAVTSRVVSDIVREAYATRLAERRHPIFVLHLELPAGMVDVNVHPQKREVRLREEGALARCLCQAVEEAWPRPQVARPLRVAEPRVPYFPSEPAVAPVPRQAEPTLMELPIEVLALYGRYILLEGAQLPGGEEGLALIDVPAARRRILYEELLAKQGKPEAQGLLVPITLDLLPAEERALEQRQGELEALGISARSCGPRAAIIDALPARLDTASAEELVRDLLTTKEELALVTATRGASRARVSSIAEAQALIKRLLRCEVPLSDPKGKPIAAHLNPEKLFK